MTTSLMPELVLWKPEQKHFTKVVTTKGYGFHTPQDGSVCKIKVLSDEGQLLKLLDGAETKELLVGDVDESIDRIVEDCVRTMKEEEISDITINFPSLSEKPYLQPDSPSEPKDSNSATEEKVPEKINEQIESPLEDIKSPTSLLPSESPASEDAKSLDSFFMQIQLLSYTREPEIWEMSITEKWRRANYHKQRGLELYARGAYQFAFRRFGLTLKYVISLEHDVPAGQEEGMDIVGLKLSCYLNVAACQMRHHNFESVVKNSSKALALQSDNAKAFYRRGAAYIQLQEFDKAKEDLSKAQQLEPKNQAIAKQQQILKAQVQKLNQYYAGAMKKMFS